MAEQQLNAPACAGHGVPRAGVVHVRHRHTERFTVVGNHLAQHDDLSLVAIGLAVHIQSRPDGALVSIRALTARFREGEVTIARALRELEAAGYLRRTVERLPNGRRVTRTVFFDLPEHLAVSQAPPPRPAKPAPPTPRPRPAAKPAGAEPPAHPEASDLLARLRTHDARLLLSTRDVARLAPALSTWLERGWRPRRPSALSAPTFPPTRSAARPDSSPTAWRSGCRPPSLPKPPHPHLRPRHARTPSRTATAATVSSAPPPPASAATAPRPRSPSPSPECVLDVDEFRDVGEAVQAGRTHGIDVLLSNPCFELWLLLHFADYRSHAESYDRLLPYVKKRHVPEHDTSHLAFRYYRDGWREAVRRARELAPEGKEREVNPATGMWRLALAVAGTAGERPSC
ncbi:RloB domain-containing protein [Streptomyces sp. DSM 42041]|uniref:RloB domain-containing protein n=1 Tax=Streptomyces hazeniae TaxID=3075538 RepID=A0ABU2NM42_9ACTN|nr:RloB domain-containing protein [Streptomyces sp. DSM 42041]MDT0377815.1 RloB domain-containing protein [Streptomyces sp. DSM 42041]